MSLLDLELEVVGLREGVDEVAAFVRSWGVDRGERLHDVANRVCLAIRCGACHGVVGALAFM